MIVEKSVVSQAFTDIDAVNDVTTRATCVSVSILGGASVRGFLIEARLSDNETLAGSFRASFDSQTLDCRQQPASAVTHVDRGDKKGVTVEWIPPATDLGDITFV